MTVKEAKEMMEELKKDGATDEELVAAFYGMFTEDKLTVDELQRLVELVGYELTEEFLNMNSEDQKTKGWADDFEDNGAIGEEPKSDEGADEESEIVISGKENLPSEELKYYYSSRFHGDDDLNEHKKAFPKQAKYETFIRDKINVGDLFLTKYKDECLLLRVKKKGHRYDPYFFLKIEDLGKYARELMKGNLVPNSSLVGGISALANLEKKDIKTSGIFKALQKRGYVEGDEIRLYPQYGLFKQVMYKEKIINIPNIYNTNECIIGRKEISLFEPFFQCHDLGVNNSKAIVKIGEGMIYFRKVDDDALSILNAIKMNNILITHALDLKCAFLPPYRTIDNLDFIYTNEGGYSYNFKDFFIYLSKRLVVADRTMNARIIITELSKFYQRNENNKFEGFSSNEIRRILDDYFVLDVTQGYYYSHDTIIDKGDHFILYDKKWLEILYNYVKKNRKKSIDSMKDIVPIKRLQDFFKLYTFSKDDFPHYLNMIHQSQSFDDFLKIVEQTLEHQYNLKKKYNL